MQRKVLRRISNMDFTETEDNALLPKVKDWINERYKQIMRFRPWQEVLFSQTLEVKDGVTEYCLNRNTSIIWSVLDATNEQEIKEINVSEYTREYEDLAITPTKYYKIGTKSVEAKLAQAEKVSVVSTSSLDVSPVVVRVVGLVSGVEIGEDIIVTGTTAAQSSNTYDTNQYLTISVGTNDGSETAQVGVITVTGVTSTTVISKIAPGEVSPEYEWIATLEEPSIDVDWTIWANRKAKKLISDNDVPIIDCCDEIVYGTYADALREDGQEDAANMADMKFNQLTMSLWASKNINRNRFIQMTPAR